MEHYYEVGLRLKSMYMRYDNDIMTRCDDAQRCKKEIIVVRPISNHACKPLADGTSLLYMYSLQHT